MLRAIIRTMVGFLEASADGVTSSMLSEVHCLAAAIVLGASSGIRATVPLFIASLSHLINENWMPLSENTEWLGHWPVCLLLFLILVVEVVADAIPAVDHAIHAVCTPLYPLAGALAAAVPNYSSSDTGGVTAVQIAMALIGGLLALGAHGGKASVRATSTATTGGLGNCVMSIVGTIGTTGIVVLALLAAVLSVLLAIAMVAGIVYTLCFFKRVATRQGRARDKPLVLTAEPPRTQVQTGSAASGSSGV